MISIRSILSLFLAAWLCAMMTAAPVQITVTVTDPDGVPIHGAGVYVGLRYTESPLAFENTDTDGRVTFVIDIPAEPIMRGYVQATMGVRDGESMSAVASRWKSLASAMQFPTKGSSFEVIIGQSDISVDTEAISTIEITGAVRMGITPVSINIIGVSADPYAATKADQEGVFSLRIARESPVFFVGTNYGFRFLAPHVPADATGPIDLGVIQLQESMGLLAGHVLVGEDAAPSGTLFAMRTDGAIFRMLFSDGEGRLDGDINAPGPDPDDPDAGIDVPAGEYVFVHLSENMINTNWLAMAAYTAVTQGVAPAQLNALPRVVVPVDGRAVVTIDYQQLETATKALVDAVLGP